MALIFMDFDGTLTRFDSFVPYCLTALVHRPRRILALGQTLRACLRFAKGEIDRQDLKEAFVWVFLGSATRDDADRWNRVFFRYLLPLLIRRAILRRARRHQRQGDRVHIVSASPDIYLEAFVREWDFDGLICTRLEWKEGRLTGKILGRNCRGEEKAKRIKALFAENEISSAHAYGDSEADKPMLRLVGAGQRV